MKKKLFEKRLTSYDCKKSDTVNFRFKHVQFKEEFHCSQNEMILTLNDV